MAMNYFHLDSEVASCKVYAFVEYENRIGL